MIIIMEAFYMLYLFLIDCAGLEILHRSIHIIIVIGIILERIDFINKTAPECLSEIDV